VHETTVRFSDGLWAKVRVAAKREGSSGAQFVRDATVARIAVDEHVRPIRAELAALLHAFELRVQQIEDAMGRHGLR
jgi:hypothetical protein